MIGSSAGCAGRTVMHEAGRDIVLGVLVGAVLVVAGFVATLNWGAREIKQAALEAPAPLLFIPK